MRDAARRFCALGARVGLAMALAAPAGAQDTDRARLVEQKTRLVERLLNSPKAREGAQSGAAEARSHYEQARTRLEAAREAAAAQDYDRAGEALDDALRALTAASARASAGGSALAESARRAENEALREQVRLYQGALVSALRSRDRPDEAKEAERVDALLVAAENATAAGRHDVAAKQLAEAYAAVAAALARTRAGETVVLSIKFDRPEDEYAYEINRYDSHRMLIELALAQSGAGSEARALVGRRVDESRRLRTQAESEAARRDHAVAIKTMEEAISHLVRALRALGVPAF
jgi:hypothetical protein